MRVCLPADAQKIRRAEQAWARLEFIGFNRTGEAVEIGQGAIAWTESVRHAEVARFLVELPAHKQPDYATGAPAGSVLSGYRLAGGVIYCAAPDPTHANKEAQCLRDRAAHASRVHARDDFIP